MTILHPSIQHIPMFPRIAALPMDHRGYPVPFFVAWVDGQPDHRVSDPAKFKRCVEESRCWICGQPLGKFLAFTIGPMCAVNRTTAEPAEHRECALYSVRACPFLSRPHAHRREAGLPEGTVEADGLMLRRNPGVALVWVTREARLTRVPADMGGGLLFRLGDPTETQWFAEGRPATREEVLASLESGLPLLEAQCETSNERTLLRQMTARAMRYLPTLEGTSV